MTIYSVVRMYNDDESVVEAKKLPAGRHEIRHGELTVPVEVQKDDSVTILLSDVAGPKRELVVDGMDVDDWGRITTETLESASLSVKPKVGEAAVSLLGSSRELNHFVSVERHRRQPVQGERFRG